MRQPHIVTDDDRRRAAAVIVSYVHERSEHATLSYPYLRPRDNRYSVVEEASGADRQLRSVTTAELCREHAVEEDGTCADPDTSGTPHTHATVAADAFASLDAAELDARSHHAPGRREALEERLGAHGAPAM
jgi:hypothetical protein